MNAKLEAREPVARYLATPPLLQHFDRVAQAPGGVARLRELILTLAVQGKLVPQDPADEPASVLLERIGEEKARLVKVGKIRKEKPLAAIAEEKMPFALPEGWEWVRLGALTLLVTDGTHHTPKYIDKGVPFISVKDIDGKTVSFADCKFIPQEEHLHINARCNPELGDILLCRIGTLGRATIVDTANAFSLFVSVGLLKLPKTVGISRYLHLTLHSPILARQYSEIKAGGSHTNKLNLGDIPTLCIPFPPLAEQSRIVARVEELMALCDALEQKGQLTAAQHERLVGALFDALANSSSAEEAADHWQRITAHFDLLLDRPAAADRLEQAILQLAVRGRLVPQNPADEPASTLLQKIRTEKDRLIAIGQLKRDKPLPPISEEELPFELPEGWCWARFPELGEFGRGKSKHRPRNDPKLFNSGKHPLVQTGEVARADRIIREYHSMYSDEGLAQSKMWPAGTLCITIAANIADAALLGFDACFPDSVVGFSPSSIIGEADYFLTFMATAKERLLEFAPATAQKNINLEILNSVLLPIPPLREMREIVERTQNLRALCTQLRDRLATTARTRSRLAEALLEQAVA